MWSADGKSVFYVSDRSGAQNLWTKAVPVPAAARQLTKFQQGRVLWPSISKDGRLIAFEHDFEIWTLDTTTSNATRVSISRRGAPSSVGVEHLSLSDGFSDLALSPDGKKVAFVARGEIFAASAKDGGDAARLTRTTQGEGHAVWSPDSRKLVYSSDRDGITHLFLYDFTTNSETQLTSGNDADHSARFSPDGKQLVFVRGDSELRALDLAAKSERSIARGLFDRPPYAGEPRSRGRLTVSGSHICRPA